MVKIIAGASRFLYELENVEKDGNRSYYGPVSAAVLAAIPALSDAGMLWRR